MFYVYYHQKGFKPNWLATFLIREDAEEWAASQNALAVDDDDYTVENDRIIQEV
jgi:hypothetical protein